MCYFVFFLKFKNLLKEGTNTNILKAKTENFSKAA